MRSRAPGDPEAHRIGDLPATSLGLGAGYERSATWGRLGRSRVVRAPKASGEPGFPASRATPLAVPPPTPRSRASGRAPWVRTGVCRAHSSSQESVQSPLHSAPARGFPSPSSEIPRAPPAHFAKARKRPSRRQRNSCLPPLSVLLPARDTPRRPPSTPATPRAHTPGKGTRGQGAGWACPLSPRRAATAARAPRPGTPLGSRAPIIHSLKRPGPLTLPPPAQTTSTIPPAERQGGAAHTKRMGSKEPRGGRDPAGARGLGSRRLFTRFLLRSLRCLRR